MERNKNNTLHSLKLERNKNKTVLRGGFKNLSTPVDYSYPLVAWEPSGKKLVMLYEKKNFFLNSENYRKSSQITFQKPPLNEISTFMLQPFMSA